MDVSNIPAGKFHQGCLAIVCSVGRNKYLGSRGLSFVERSREIRHLVAGGFISVGIGKVAIGHQYSYHSEGGLDTDAAIAFAWPADLRPRRVRIVGQDFAMTKGEEARYERSHPVC